MASDMMTRFKCTDGTFIGASSAQAANMAAKKLNKTLLINATKEQLDQYMHRFGKHRVNFADACQIDHLQDLI